MKFFFSEGLQTDSGEEVSTREIKRILQDCIENEEKRRPLTDERLTEILQEKGYQIARRTVAKYREQLNIPVARLRREIGRNDRDRQQSETSITEKLAKIVSVVFHPLFMPLYGLAILMSAPTFLRYLPVEAKRILFMVVLINNVFIPLSLLPFLRYRNIISSYHIDDRKERIIPLLTASILYCTTSFIVFRFQVPFFLKSFIFATSVVAIVCR